MLESDGDSEEKAKWTSFPSCLSSELKSATHGKDKEAGKQI